MELILGIALISSIVVNGLLLRFVIIAGKDERKDLHDRILSLLSPEAMVVKTSLQRTEEFPVDDEAEDVVYVDDRRELELQKVVDNG